MPNSNLPARLSCLTGWNRVTANYNFGVFLEIQGKDTVLPTAGVPIQTGDLYYGIHMHPLGDQPIMQALASSLAVTARGLQHPPRLQRAEGAPPPRQPRQIVGVTHWSLARLAVYAGFQCVEVDPEIFNAEENVMVGWPRFVSDLRDKYVEKTERGQKGKQMRIGVVSQPVDTFTDRWAHRKDHNAVLGLARATGCIARPLVRPKTTTLNQ